MNEFMTPKERRGKWLFLILAGLIVLEKLAGIGFALSDGLGQVNWFKSVVTPLGVLCAVIALWYGELLMQRLVGGMYILIGASQLYLAIRSLQQLQPKLTPDNAEFLIATLGTAFYIIAAFAVVYLLLGLLFLFSPSMSAFFRYQREGPGLE